MKADQVTSKKGKSVKRERSLTTKLTRKSFAAERMFESNLTVRRRSSLNRLRERIREKQQGKKGTDAGNEKDGKKAVQQRLADLSDSGWIIKGSDSGSDSI